MARTKHGLPGIYNSSPITLSNEEGSALALNAAGEILVASGTGASALGKAEDAAHASGDVGVEMLSKRTDTAASSAGTDGDYATVNTDSLGHLWGREGFVDQAVDNTNAVYGMQIKPLAVSTYSPTLFTNYGANATLNVKATPGNVVSVYCVNLNAAIRYLQLHNTATTPGGAAVPLMTFAIPASGSIVFGTDFFTQAGMNFSTGIAFAFSTTQGTYTAGTAGDQFTQIHFK